MKLSARSSVPWLFLALGIFLATVVVEFAVVGSDYYTSNAEERFLHSKHDFLRPSGKFGLIVGIAGTACMLLNLTYLVRKRLAAITWLGNLRSWMSFHVLTGIIGPALIVLHSAFRLESALATLAFVSMLIVVFTGIVGRSIYGLVPRSLEGRELGAGEVHRRLSETLSQIRELGVGENFLQATSVARDVTDPESSSFLTTVLDLLFERFRIDREYRRLRRSVLADSALRPRAGEILPLARNLCRERSWYSRYEQLRRVMGAWRFFHRWLAIVMLLMLLFHVIVAVSYGDLWIFKSVD